MTDEIYPYIVMAGPEDVYIQVASIIRVPVSRDALRRLAVDCVTIYAAGEDKQTPLFNTGKYLKREENKMPPPEDYKISDIVGSMILPRVPPSTVPPMHGNKTKQPSPTARLKEAMDNIGDDGHKPAKILTTKCEVIPKD